MKPSAYGAVRAVLIAGGVAAYSGLGLGGAPAGQTYVLWGLGLQVLLLVVHALVRRHAPDGASVLPVVELVGDGATVLLFALGTFGAITQTITDL